MKPRHLMLLILLAAVGYAALARLFPQYPTNDFGYRLDRSGAIRRAREEAARRGIEADAWRTGAETEIQGNSVVYLRDQPHPEFAAILTPIVIETTLSEPSTNRRFNASLAADGRLIGYVRREQKGAAAVPSTPEADQQLAETAFAELAGDLRSRFTRKPTPPAATENRTLSWEMTIPDESRVKLTVDVSVANGIVTSSSLYPSYSPAYLERLRRERGPLNNIGVGFAILLLISLLAAFICYVLHIVRKEVRHRSTLMFLVGVLLLIIIWGVNGSFHEDIFTDMTGSPPLKSVYLGLFLATLLFTLLNVLFASPFFLLYAAGYPYAVQLAKNPLRTIELIVRGHFRSRLVGRSLMFGLTLGWIFPLIPTVLAASGLFANADLRPGALAESFNASAPVFSPPTDIATIQIYTLFTIFAFLYPLIGSLWRHPLIVRLILVVLATVALLAASQFRVSMAAAITAAGLQAIVFAVMTHRVDLLAGILALISGDFTLRLCAYLSQPSPSLQAWGWGGWGLLGLVMIAAAAVALRGREIGEEEARALWVNEGQRVNRVDRERLKAEFEVARRAQQRMLPDAPPELPGFEISAVCRPAREVGGDLYDFLPLPDGRLGIVVADVSGKGVPASLYMTLTKGLLASVSETTSDPGAILQEVNRHLYVACKKKMFVTLLLAVFDPERKTLTYARAGHNPPVWRRNLANQTSLLRAPGIGLGLNAGELFKRTMKVETQTLTAQDLLILYSDGITEAMNEQREEYGEERLMALADRLNGLSAELARNAVMTDVGSFLGRTPPQDDQTLVVVRVL